METFVFAAVLLAAFCHATWNALLKIGLDPLRSATLMVLGGAGLAIVALPFLPAPAAASLPWILASSAVHLFYFIGLVESYRTGDLSQVYPIARGGAPLMTAAASTLFVGESLGTFGWAGIVTLALGVLLLSLRGGRDLAKIDRRAVGFALFTAATICTYTVIDGIGARLSGAPLSYALCLFIGMACVLIPYLIWREGTGAFRDMTPFWKRGLAGGCLQIAAYGIALWAMTYAPIAIVAALRETSVLFAAAIAIVVLKEPLRAVRVMAAFLIVAGLAAIRLS